MSIFKYKLTIPHLVRLKETIIYLFIVQNIGFLVNIIYTKFNLARFRAFESLLVKLYFIYKAIFEKKLIDNLKLNVDDLIEVIDVGGGFGFYSKTITEINSKAVVYCFEPDIVNHTRIKVMIDRYNLEKRIILFQKAVSNQSNSLFLEKDKANPLNHRVTTSQNKGVEVQCVDIDSFCHEEQIKPTLIKIDIQGHEIFALEGAINTISKFKPDIILEINNNDDESNNLACWNLLQSQGYSAFKITKEGNLVPIKCLPQNRGYFDIVFKFKAFP